MEYLIILMIMFVAACLQGISGFGSGLIAVPLLVLWLPLSTLTPLLSVVNLAMALYLGWLLRHAIARASGLGCLAAACLEALLDNTY